MSVQYAELQVTTYFSFLRGASSPIELFEQAKALGIEALGICDRNSLAGMVQAHVAAKETGIRLVVGCRLDLADFAPVLVYSTDRAAYGRLCRLLSLGKARAGKGKCHLLWEDLVAWGEGLLVILLPDTADDACALHLRKLKDAFADRASMALTLRRRPNDQMRLYELANLVHQARVPMVVTNDVLFHTHDRRILQDVVTCIRNHTTIDEAGFARERHADRYLKPPAEMARLFSRYPEAIDRTREIVAHCRFSLDDLAYQYPDEVSVPGQTPQQALEALTWEGAAAAYPEGIRPEVRKTLSHELALIGRMDYAPYFLTVHSIVRYARSQGILCQGRGSAANSAVCYVLGITAIDPARTSLIFERFVSEERREPPDIDVDFEHARREQVIQWIYGHYGRNHAALTAVVTRYRAKGALRDVGKVMGLPEDLIRTLSGQIWGWGRKLDEDALNETGIDLSDRRIRLTLDLARCLIGVPRHLSQHPGGFVLTHDRLDELVPIEPAAMDARQIIEWDKDDIDVLKFMKVDVLALGMLTCMKKGLDLLAEHKGQHYTLQTIPAEDPRTYAMIRKADTIGVFQIESRAQMSMLPRLRPRVFYDLVIEVAIVRPGPIQMGWTASMRHQCAMMRSEDHSEETARMKVTIIGLDIAKSVFQVHGTDASGKCLLKKKLGRSEVISFFERLERCLVVLEACSTSHHWARVIRDTGHEVKLIPPEMVKPFVKRGKKNDAVDAAAICLAAIHPDTRFVPIKNREQQSLLSLHSTRTLLVKQQTMLVNALRALAAEFGLIVPLGNARLPELLAKIETSSNLPDALKQTTMLLFEQYGRLNESIENLEGGIRTHAKQDEDARRLLTIPGIGPVTASLIVASVTDIGAFDTARHFAAWLGLVPRQHSSGGKTRLGRITKTGNREIRKMLVLSATSMLYRAQKWDSAAGVWLCKLLERRPGRLATVALANKLARIIWVLLSRKEIYRPAGRSVAIV
ncbi:MULTISPECIES: IS110 family RNA-guided transposase [Komagataeibacter]|uniref:IS110 family transposase n=1 Tax=Komagataeibacter oboediens TaxID=65958 RepID=A0ABS5SV27_9PROT|nr:MULTISPECIES: IS110 family transposase [Komagataeibacter]MBE7728970.1 IS110 family transposase [Komagataeibacter sp. FXV3]MBT0676985.1 IS110 family transposase [Komagataeibacter oboediens]MBT0680314.1 IS110 family transposase [Komagataeibacter oboediens]GCE90417.1 transposase [Komagataeibacter diospyri]